MVKIIQGPTTPIPELSSLRCQLGEGPQWEPETGFLHFVDIVRGEVHHFNPTTREHKVDYYDSPISAIRLLKNEQGYLAAAHRGIAILPSMSKTPSSSPSSPIPLSTYYLSKPFASDRLTNDAEVDPSGKRFFVGLKWDKTVLDQDKQVGQLWCFELDKDGNGHGGDGDGGKGEWKCKKVLDGLTCPNGIGWSEDNKTMYFTDSEREKILKFDYDLSTGNLTNQRIFNQTNDLKKDGVPDGFAIDDKGGIWDARWSTNKIMRFDPSGELTHELVIPFGMCLTACEFGGPNLSTLFITSASLSESGQDISDPQLVENHPQAGAVYEFNFELDLGTDGLELLKFKGRKGGRVRFDRGQGRQGITTI